MPIVNAEFFAFVRNNLGRLVEKFGAPFIIHDGPGIRDRIRRINGAFQGEGLNFTELFAVKANPRLALFEEVMIGEGVGADCSSDAELYFAEEVGLPGEKIMLTANNVSPWLYRRAMSLGAHLNLDDITCIAKVPDPMPRCVSLRLNLGKGSVLASGEESGKIDFNREGSKFGIPLVDMPVGYGLLTHRGVEEFGNHSMMVSNNLDYRKSAFIVEQQFKVLDEMVTKFGKKGSYVNIGGGLGIPYLPGDQEYDVEALARECARCARAFEKKHGYMPKIFMESGRYVTGPAGILINRIENIYSKFGHKFLGVQIAMHAMPRPMLYQHEDAGHHHHVIVAPDGSLRDGLHERVSIVGAACEDNDRLETDIMLPPAREGDFVFSFSAGAHCVDQASDYNWQYKPQELMIDTHGYVRRICSKRNYADLTARQRFLDGAENILHL